MNEAAMARTPNWPGDPATLTAQDVDFEALAHVLANTCCWGGRSRTFYSLAQHAVNVSAAVARLGRMAEEDRRVLGLHSLLADAPLAWTGFAAAPASAVSGKAAEKSGREKAAVRSTTAVRSTVLEAAGLDPELPENWAEALTFMRRMAVAALHRDFPDAGIGEGAGPHGPGPLFPPLKGRIRPVAPDRAARLWLERFSALSAGDAGGADRT